MNEQQFLEMYIVSASNADAPVSVQVRALIDCVKTLYNEKYPDKAPFATTGVTNDEIARARASRFEVTMQEQRDRSEREQAERDQENRMRTEQEQRDRQEAQITDEERARRVQAEQHQALQAEKSRKH